MIKLTGRKTLVSGWFGMAGAALQRRWRAAGLAVAALALALAQPAAAAEWPAAVQARYTISFAGIEVGWFDFESRVGAREYALSGKGNVSALFGAFKWRGQSQSQGLVQARGPDPMTYSLDFKANSKRGGIRMGFRGGRVTQLEIFPQRRRKRRKPNPRRARKYAPLLPEHMAGVLDPLAAIMALTRSIAGNPCDKSLSIFDGKQRFDLRFSYLGRERRNGASAGGHIQPGYVCAVRYVPVGGYKRNRATRYIAESNGIRVVMRPVPAAGVAIPAKIQLPTIAGSAVMSAKQVVITTANNQRIAMRR